MSLSLRAQFKQDVQVDTLDNLVIRIDSVSGVYTYKVKYIGENITSRGYSDERYSSLEHYGHLYQSAWNTAIAGVDSNIFGCFFSDYLIQKGRTYDSKSGFINLSISNTGFIFKYTLVFKGENRKLFSFEECSEIFHLLNNSIFNPWHYDIDIVTGTIGFKLL